MCLNHPETIPLHPPVLGKLAFHENGCWCQNVGTAALALSVTCILRKFADAASLPTISSSPSPPVCLQHLPYTTKGMEKQNKSR